MMYNPYMPMASYPQMQQNAAQNPFGFQGINNPYHTQNAPQANQSEMTYVLPVASVKDFDSVTIQPGRRALIMAQNEPFIAFKAADAMGMVQTSLYRIEPVTPDQMDHQETEYATKTELHQLQKIVQQIVDKLAPNNTSAKKEAASE